MKFLLLVLLLGTFTKGYSVPVEDIILMSVGERHRLFFSIKEVADNYQTLGQTNKAKAFYKSAIKVFPIGDEAHKIANKIGVVLNDADTYSNFIQMGETNQQAGRYQQAISLYLMANELENSKELYNRMSVVYGLLGDQGLEEYYGDLATPVALSNNVTNDMADDTTAPMMDEMSSNMMDDTTAPMMDEMSSNMMDDTTAPMMDGMSDDMMNESATPMMDGMSDDMMDESATPMMDEMSDDMMEEAVDEEF